MCACAAQVKAGGQIDKRLIAAVEVLKQHKQGSAKQKNMLLAQAIFDRVREVSNSNAGQHAFVRRSRACVTGR